jgi:predicted kinase
MCYRAAVRGKVESLHSAGDGVGAAEEAASLALARRYFRLALQYALTGSKPHAFAIMGRVASGKSTLARALGEELGWSVLSSDCIRKTLASVPLCQRGNAAERSALYAVEMTEKVYAAMFQQAVESLQRGEGVILDATFSARAHRDGLRRQLEQKGFGVIWIEVSAEEAASFDRLRGREGAVDVVSDARLEDRAMLNATYEPPDEASAQAIIMVSTGAEPSVTLRRTMEELAKRNAYRNQRM